MLHWGQIVAPVGLTPSGVRMSARFRGQGCNQTAGRLPRLLSRTGVDAGVCLCVCPSLRAMAERYLLCLNICVSVFLVSLNLFYSLRLFSCQLDTVLSVSGLDYEMQLSQY